jgi:hypothetical protein
MRLRTGIAATMAMAGLPLTVLQASAGATRINPPRISGARLDHIIGYAYICRQGYQVQKVTERAGESITVIHDARFPTLPRRCTRFSRHPISQSAPS